MKKLIAESFALKGILTILSLLVIFHLMILCRVIPFEQVWGGRLKDVSEMISFESISIIINVLLLIIVVARTGVLKINIAPKLFRIAFGAMFLLFLLNTLGNVLSVNDFEKLVFTPITLVLSVFCLRLAL